jgi:hypothetical protein
LAHADVRIGAYSLRQRSEAPTTTAPTPLQHRHAHRGLRVLAVVLAVVAAAAVVMARFTDETGSPVRGSGVPTVDVRRVPPFTALELAGTNAVTVRIGAVRAVSVRGDDNLVPLVTTEVKDGTLVVGGRGSYATKTPLRITVVTPTLRSVALTGTGAVAVEGVRGDAFTADLAGAGSVSAAGAVRRLRVTLDGTGAALLQRLRAANVVASVSGAGSVQVHPTESLVARVEGSGSIVYGGNPPKVTRRVEGTGAITRA